MFKNSILIRKFSILCFVLLILSSGCISNRSTTTTTPAPTQKPQEFEIIDLRVAPENPEIGDTLIILVDVQNRGDSSGEFEVTVSIGMKLISKTVSIEAKSSKTVQFQEKLDKEGKIEIKTGDLTRIIYVSSLETPPPTTQPPKMSPTPTPKNPFFYTLIGKFIQRTVHVYEIHLKPRNEKSVYCNTVLVPSVSSYHFSQQIFSQKIEYSEDPDSVMIKKEDSVEYKMAEWNNPPSEITVKRTVECKNIVSYFPFITQSKYPLDTNLPPEVRVYLESDVSIQADDPEIKNLAKNIVKGCESEMDAITKILNWVRYNVQYTCSKELKVCEGVSFVDAKRTLKYRKGNCVNFANLSIALLRSAGIPAKRSGGYVADSEHESAAAHAWISVYIPEKGFVEFESSYWMPRSGLVPETVLLSQHISWPSEIGVSDASFSETHRSTQSITATPEKKISFSESIDKNDIISFPVYVEVEWVTGKHNISFSAAAPEGWKVFLSNENVEINSDYYNSKEIWVTIIPPSDVISGEKAEIVITADDETQKGEIVVFISIT